MEPVFPRGEAPCLDALALHFVETRGRCEIEFAAAALQDPGLAVEIAAANGVNEESFYVHYDARLMYCACAVAWRYGRDVVYRLALEGLRSECAAYDHPGYLACVITPFLFSNKFLLTVHLLLTAKRLGRMHAAQRDAQEHIDYAKNLLARGAA